MEGVGRGKREGLNGGAGWRGETKQKETIAKEKKTIQIKIKIKNPRTHTNPNGKKKKKTPEIKALELSSKGAGGDEKGVGLLLQDRRDGV